MEKLNWSELFIQAQEIDYMADVTTMARGRAESHPRYHYSEHMLLFGITDKSLIFEGLRKKHGSVSCASEKIFQLPRWATPRSGAALLWSSDGLRFQVGSGSEEECFRYFNGRVQLAGFSPSGGAQASE